MKTIQSSKDITTLEVGDKVIFGDLKYKVCLKDGYFLSTPDVKNDKIFTILNISKRDFVKNLGIKTLPLDWDFPEVKSLEALTAIVSALFKEYEKQNCLPKTWDEFCDKYPVTNNEAILSHNSVILTFDDFPNTATERDPDVDRNFCTSLTEAEAFLAFIQLRQLRKAYVKDWEPDWKDNKQYKACIMCHSADFIITYFKDLCSSPLSFPTYELAEQFLTNFKDLLEIAKPLL